MRLFVSYLWSHRRLLGAWALFCVIFAAVFALYHLPFAAVGYAVLVCAFFGAGFFVVDYLCYCKKHHILTRMLEEISVTAEHLPDPQGMLEEDYQVLLKALLCWEKQTQEAMDSRYGDLTEYYTLWAHQIKTPIAAMRLLLQSDPVPQGAELTEELQKIEQYVEMVLCYLRLDGGTTDYVIREYDLDDIIRQAVRKYASQFIRKKIRLEYEPVSCMVLSDEKWLLFVLEQVLSNALKYTPAGTISIYLEDRQTLCIRDTGMGIAPEDLPRVFEKGFTGYNGREDKKATGIGLYLCKRILTKLGHTIRLESLPGEGTTVRIGLEKASLEVE